MPVVHLIVMGVSATGKSTVAQRLAEVLDRRMVEGDDLHPRANVEKMESGHPLTDEDRWPWLDRINEAMRASDEDLVVTCSALRRAYRDRLRAGPTSVLFVHLEASYDVLEPRMATRDKHFMPTSLLRSQLDTLEDLEPDEDGVVVDVTPPLDEVVEAALAAVRDRLSDNPPR